MPIYLNKKSGSAYCWNRGQCQDLPYPVLHTEATITQWILRTHMVLFQGSYIHKEIKFNGQSQFLKWYLWDPNHNTWRCFSKTPFSCLHSSFPSLLLVSSHLGHSSFPPTLSWLHPIPRWKPVCVARILTSFQTWVSQPHDSTFIVNSGSFLKFSPFNGIPLIMLTQLLFRMGCFWMLSPSTDFFLDVELCCWTLLGLDLTSYPPPLSSCPDSEQTLGSRYQCLLFLSLRTLLIKVESLQHLYHWLQNKMFALT